MNDQIENVPSNEFEFENFFAQLQPSEERRVIELPYRLKLQRIKERQRLVSEYLSDIDSFDRYVQAHPLASSIERKIAEEVALHRFDLQRIQDVEQRSELEQYRALAGTNYVDPSSVF